MKPRAIVFYRSVYCHLSYSSLAVRNKRLVWFWGGVRWHSDICDAALFTEENAVGMARRLNMAHPELCAQIKEIDISKELLSQCPNEE